MLKKEEKEKKKQISKKNDHKNGKDISRTFSGVVGIVGQFIFGYFLGPAYISQDL